MKTILTPQEVIYFSGISEQFPVCDLRTIHQIEYAEFRTCLGNAFYVTLKNDLVKYSPNEYNGATGYVIDGIVKYRGLIYKAIQNSTGIPPSNHEYWELAPKFTTECYETLWCTFLAPYLAWQVIRSRLPFIWRQVKSEGIVAIFGGTFQAANIKEFQVLHQAVAAEAQMTFDNMDHYLKSDESGCFGKYLGNATECCPECGEETCTCNNSCSQKSTGYGYNFG